MALCYVLLHIRPFDSIAQATSQASGVKYARIIFRVLKRLRELSQDEPSEDVIRHDRGKPSIRFLQQRNPVVVREFAMILAEEV